MNQTQIRSEILLIHIYSDNSLGVEEPRIQFLWQPWKACWISLYKSQQSNVFSWYLLKKWEKVFHLINRVYGLTPRSNEYSRGKDVTNGFHLFPHRHYHLNCIECFFFFFFSTRIETVLWGTIISRTNHGNPIAGYGWVDWLKVFSSRWGQKCGSLRMVLGQGNGILND